MKNVFLGFHLFSFVFLEGESNTLVCYRKAFSSDSIIHRSKWLKNHFFDIFHAIHAS